MKMPAGQRSKSTKNLQLIRDESLVRGFMSLSSSLRLFGKFLDQSLEDDAALFGSVNEKGND